MRKFFTTLKIIAKCIAIFMSIAGAIILYLNYNYLYTGKTNALVFDIQRGYVHVALVRANQGYKIDKIEAREFLIPFFRWYIFWSKVADKEDDYAIEVGPNADPLLDWWLCSRTRQSVFFNIYRKISGGFGSLQFKCPGFGVRVDYGNWGYLDGSTVPEYFDNGARCYEIHASGWLIGSIGLILMLLIWKKPRRTLGSLCPACGYDLRGTPDRCPECGRETSAAEREKILKVVEKSDL